MFRPTHSLTNNQLLPQPNFYTSHRVQHFKDLYPFVHKYHHVGHPTTPWEAQEGGMMEFWSAHTAFLLV